MGTVIKQVDPYLIVLDDLPSPRDVAYQKQRLEDEGQIEPIEVIPLPAGGCYLLDQTGWIYAGAQVAAARDLKWPTLLVTY